MTDADKLQRTIDKQAELIKNLETRYKAERDRT